MTSKRKAVLIILDGFGVAPASDVNAITRAKTPTYDRLLEQYPNNVIDASESHVGLPEGFMGNSEVGHLNIGAGRVVFQDFSLISNAIEDGSFFQNPVFEQALTDLKVKPKTSLHLMGLVSDGGVHSHITHLMALLELAKRSEVERVKVHAFLDGRDTPPTSGIEHLERLQAFCSDLKLGEIATVSGRFYAMDRDKRWERTEAAYQTIVGGQSEFKYKDPIALVRENYEREVTDEFIEPSVSEKYSGIADGDVVLFFNFRADRARQLSAALTQLEFPHFRRSNFPALGGFVSLTKYDDSFTFPVAYTKKKVERSLGEVVSGLGLKQLRIAETEKYAHVTYFFNGGDEKVFEGEERILIPSPREVRTYDQKPQMSAREVTDRLLSELKQDKFDFVVVNFANPDMVGHTGNISAAISAIETVDGCLKSLVEWIEKEDAIAILTADHGNCEMMLDAKGAPMTAHTTQPVPFIVIDPKRRTQLVVSDGGRLCDVAPTLLELWGMDIPQEMTGRSLIDSTRSRL